MKSLMKWYLERHGYLVLKQSFVGLVIGGNATAYYVDDESGTNWNISFPFPVYFYALNGTYVQRKERR